MEEKSNKKIALSTIRNNWEASGIQGAIKKNIEFYESIIFSVHPEDNDKVYTAKDLNIEKRNILIKLINMPTKMLEEEEAIGPSYNEEDVLKGFMEYN